MKNNKLIYVLMTIAAFSWSSAFIAGKFAVPFIPTFTLTFLRFAIASAVLFPIMLILNKKNPKEKYTLRKKHLPFFAFTSLVGMFGYHILFFNALKYTTAINSSLIGAMNPIITVIIGFLFLRKALPRLQVFGIVISFVGVILTVTGADLQVLSSISFNKGDILMFAAVICWAAYGVYSRAKGGEIPPVALTFYSFFFCTIILIPFVLLENPFTMGPIPTSAIVGLFSMALFSSVMGYLIQQISIKEIGAAKTSVFVNLVPIFSIILSVLILGEELEPVKLFTALMIILGVCICQYGSRDGLVVEEDVV